MNQKLFVSVVIPMYNEARHIGECLTSLINQDYDTDLYEVLVIDGRSEDGSAEIVRQYDTGHPSINVVENPRRIIPAAFNIGVEHARGDVVYFVGAHSTIPADFLSKTVQTLVQTGADCVGGAFETVGGSFIGQAIALAVSHPFGVGNARYRYSRKADYVDTVGFGAYRKEAFERTGRFNEELAGSNEDYEFNYRLRKAGGRIFFNPEIRAFYRCRDTITGLIKQYFRYGTWKTEVVLNHPGAFQLRHQIPPIFLLTLLLSGVLGIFYRTFAWLFLGILGIYLCAIFLVTLTLALDKRKLYTMVLPLVFAGLHFAFGTGFLWHLGKRIFRAGGQGDKGTGG